MWALRPQAIQGEAEEEPTRFPDSRFDSHDAMDAVPAASGLPVEATKGLLGQRVGMPRTQPMHGNTPDVSGDTSDKGVDLSKI
jgi:hypothetical protein